MALQPRKEVRDGHDIQEEPLQIYFNLAWEPCVVGITLKNLKMKRIAEARF
jgi:hypothetical protein